MRYQQPQQQMLMFPGQQDQQLQQQQHMMTAPTMPAPNQMPGVAPPQQNVAGSP